MAKQQSGVTIITVAQPYGCGASRIAVQLAMRLQWQLIDQEIIRRAASLLGIAEEEAEFYDEHNYSLLDRFLCFMAFSTPEALSSWSNQYSVPISPVNQERLYHEALGCLVQEMASSNQRILIGHGTQAVLADRPDVLHIQVVAPFAHRIEYVMQRDAMSKSQAALHLKRKDYYRERYFRQRFHRDVHDPLLYDLVVNGAAMDLDTQVDLILLALERKTCCIA